MRIEPELDRTGLSAMLRDRYRLDVDRLTFVPFGLDSWSYVASCRDGSRVFVKLSRPGTSAQAAGSELPLMAALADEGVAVPRPTRDRDGGLVNVFDGFDVHILEHIEGHNLETESAWPDDLYAHVAETVAAVHAATTSVRGLVDRREDYQLQFLPGLTATLETLEAGGQLPSPDGATVAQLRELLRPWARDLRTAIDRLERLRDQAAAVRSDQVLCHTDIWGSNLLLSDDGSLRLLDWNGALIGPPEHDLFMFADISFFPADRFGWFLDRYDRALPNVRLDTQTFGFYIARRNLEDLAWFVGALAAGHTDSMDPAGMIRIAASLLAELPEIEGEIRRVAGVLEARLASQRSSRR